MATKQATDSRTGHTNPDPITGEPGAHPIGAGIGAAAGGAVAGAGAGAVAGPVGTVAGAVLGGVAGGLAGKGVAERIDPTVEDAYRRDEYPKRDYFTPDFPYEDLAPAYRYGWEARAQHRDRTWDEVEPDLQNSWETSPTSGDLAWEKARCASRDAWDRVEQALPSDAEIDRGVT